MSDITVSSDIHTFMQSASNSAARDNLGVGDTDAVNHASLTLTGNATAVEFIGDLEGAVRFSAKAGEDLTKGNAVYVSGVSGNLAIVSKADSSNAATMPCFGLAGSTVSQNASVQIITFGTLSSIDTSAFTLGDTLYVNGTGTLSATKPTGESNLVQNIGKVQRVHASAGSIKVGGAGRSNDTPNLNENKIFIGNSSNAASTAAIGTVITDNASSVKTSYESNSDTNAYTDAEKTKLSGIATGAEVNAVDSVNSQTGSVTLDADNIDDTSTTHKFATSAQLTKLDGIEASADVTDATNVNAAGATMNTDTDVSGNSWVLDEDSMSSNDATKVPTQQSVKAYVDANSSSGDATSIQGTDVNSSVGSPSDGDILVYRSAGSDFVLEAKPAAGTNPAAADITDATADGIALITSADANPFTDADESKLDGIAAGAEVNTVDSVNAQTGVVVLDADDIDDTSTSHKFVTASDLSTLSNTSGTNTGDQDLSSYQLQPSEGAFQDGDKTKLDGISAGAEVNAVDSVNTQTGAVVLDADDISDAATTKKFTTAADISKLAGIEAGADVTDTANVQAAGALMDSEVDADIKTLSLPASTTISTFGASLIDDADAATARTTLGVDAAGTDNSTNVTLTGSGTYLSIAGQAITVDPITESDISDLGTYLTAESDTLDSVTGRGATTTNSITVGSIDINGEIIELAVNTTSVTGSTALDPANGTIQRLTFSGAVTFTDSLVDGESITLHIDDGTAYTATWPTMEWVGGSAPTLDTTNEHIIVIWKVNSTLYGMASGVAS